MLLARTREGYANISRLFTLANAADRREPRLDPARLAEHAGGVVLLTGGRDGPLSKLLSEGRREDAGRLLRSYRDWYGPDGVYVELQQNFLKGDTARNRELAELARSAGVPLAASNDVHYHSRDRYRLQHALAAAKRNVTIEQALPFIKPNDHLCLKHPDRMKEIFRRYPEAVANTGRIAERCEFNLATGLGYSLPECGRATVATPPMQLPAAALLRGRPETLRPGVPAGGGPAGGGVPAHRQARTWPGSCCSTGRSCCWVGRSWRRGVCFTRKLRWRSVRRAGAGAPRWPCWQATSSASATWTPSGGA